MNSETVFLYERHRATVTWMRLHSGGDWIPTQTIREGLGKRNNDGARNRMGMLCTELETAGFLESRIMGAGRHRHRQWRISERGKTSATVFMRVMLTPERRQQMAESIRARQAQMKARQMEEWAKRSGKTRHLTEEERPGSIPWEEQPPKRRIVKATEAPALAVNRAASSIFTWGSLCNAR